MIHILVYIKILFINMYATKRVENQPTYFQ